MGREKSNFILKRNLYENCKVRNLEGEVIFFCSTKRAQWYLKRNLATIINKEPLEVQLTFETNGPGNLGDKFYLQSRKNLCVVCGSEDMLTRHHVVPYGFRKFLPDSVKNHSYHDVLLLCVPCHEKYEQHADDLKKQLGREYGAPVDGEWDKELHEGKRKARAAARTLLKFADRIPAERRDRLVECIRIAVGTDDLQQVASMQFEADVKVLGEIVVSKLTDINNFLYRWRAHFVETMSPKYMPEHWSVEREKR